MHKNSFVKLFERETDPRNFETLFDDKQMSLSISRSGSTISTEVPCLKAEFLFPPQYSLMQVANAVKNEKLRRNWDRNI